MSVSKYVLHRHLADRAGSHLDLRIQIPNSNDLYSFALPKSKIPSSPKEKYLAILGEPHPASWLTFQGNVPKGEYGAGKVEIVDKGTAQIVKWSDDSIKFSANSKLLKGTFVLVKFKTADRNNNWLFMRAS